MSNRTDDDGMIDKTLNTAHTHTYCRGDIVLMLSRGFEELLHVIHSLTVKFQSVKSDIKFRTVDPVRVVVKTLIQFRRGQYFSILRHETYLRTFTVCVN